VREESPTNEPLKKKEQCKNVSFVYAPLSGSRPSCFAKKKKESTHARKLVGIERKGGKRKGGDGTEPMQKKGTSTDARIVSEKGAS